MQVFKCRQNVYYNDKIYIMGILNITPDSFSDGGRFFSVENAVAQALRMQSDGADFIDVGAVSTRPGASFVSESEELERLLPVLHALKGKVQVPISIDTHRPSVAKAALENGAAVINDVGNFADEMANIIRSYHAGWIAVHTVGDAGSEIVYPNGVVAAVQAFFDDFYAHAVKSGIAPEQLMFDPGFGFSKNTQQNMELLENLHRLNTHGCFLLTALSRKRFVGEMTNTPQADQRLAGTLQFDRIAVNKGSCIVRVHDVKENREMLKGF